MGFPVRGAAFRCEWCHSVDGLPQGLGTLPRALSPAAFAAGRAFHAVPLPVIRGRVDAGAGAGLELCAVPARRKSPFALDEPPCHVRVHRGGTAVVSVRMKALVIGLAVSAILIAIVVARIDWREFAVA